jgi:hypothetical protein
VADITLIIVGVGVFPNGLSRIGSSEFILHPLIRNNKNKKNAEINTNNRN